MKNQHQQQERGRIVHAEPARRAIQCVAFDRKRQQAKRRENPEERILLGQLPAPHQLEDDNEEWNADRQRDELQRGQSPTTSSIGRRSGTITIARIDARDGGWHASGRQRRAPTKPPSLADRRLNRRQAATTQQQHELRLGVARRMMFRQQSNRATIRMRRIRT